MDFIQFAVFLVANMAFTLTLWLWNRSESRADQRQTMSIVESLRDTVRAIDLEMKDFHGRLCAIEERNRGK